MASIIQLRRDTAANWTSANPTLAQGELGVETDTSKIKVGDGSTAWSSLSYLIDTGGYAVLDTDQAWTGSQRATIVTDNDGSFDLDAGQNFSCTPTGNFTLTFTNIPNGQSGWILLVNSGGHTVSLHTNSKADSNFTTTVSTAGTYLISYFSNGTNVYLTTSAAIS